MVPMQVQEWMHIQPIYQYVQEILSIVLVNFTNHYNFPKL